MMYQHASELLDLPALMKLDLPMYVERVPNPWAAPNCADYLVRIYDRRNGRCYGDTLGSVWRRYLTNRLRMITK